MKEIGGLDFWSPDDVQDQAALSPPALASQCAVHD